MLARTFEASHPAVDADAVQFRTSRGRAAALMVGEVEPAVRRIAWSEIEHVDAGRFRVWPRVVTGLIVGAALGGAALWTASGTDIAEPGDAGVLELAALLTLGGGTVGLIAGMGAPIWRHVYP